MQASGVHRDRSKIGVFYRTEPLCTENLPRKPSSDHFRPNRNSLFHSEHPMFLDGYCPIKSKNSAQTGRFSVSNRFAGSQSVNDGQEPLFSGGEARLLPVGRSGRTNTRCPTPGFPSRASPKLSPSRAGQSNFPPMERHIDPQCTWRPFL